MKLLSDAFRQRVRAAGGDKRAVGVGARAVKVCLMPIELPRSLLLGGYVSAGHTNEWALFSEALRRNAFLPRYGRSKHVLGNEREAFSQDDGDDREQKALFPSSMTA